VISSAIAGFQMKHNTFGRTVRLCKRWLNAHLLSGKVPEELIELTVIYVYSNIQPFPTVPCDSLFAFFRWLRLLASFPWTTEPLLVSINGSQLDRGSALANMSAAATVVPFVVSEYDMTSQWSRAVQVALALSLKCLLTLHHNSPTCGGVPCCWPQQRRP
jgi:hypothetical protein